jgi:hypothetical protein
VFSEVEVQAAMSCAYRNLPSMRGRADDEVTMMGRGVIE